MFADLLLATSAKWTSPTVVAVVIVMYMIFKIEIRAYKTSSNYAIFVVLKSHPIVFVVDEKIRYFDRVVD